MKEYQILENLVKFNTIKDKDNNKLIEYIENILKNKGFKTIHKGKYLIMSYKENPTFGFLGHMDTVPFTNGWDTDPFILSKKDGNIYGLGVCDMKGGIAAIIDAVLSIDLNKVKNGIKLYFTYDEEIGFGGIYDIINKKEKFPDFMLFGEPTDNEILIGSKGLLECKLSFNGIKAHASNPLKGDSANLKAIKCLNELDNFYNKQIKKDMNYSYEIPYTTMNIGIINGGSSKNSISDNCIATLDFRPVSITHTELILNKISKLCKKYNRTNEIVEKVDPFFNDIELNNDKKTANFITEASLVNTKSKIILGPGPVTAHEVNEHISETSYKKTVEQYKDIINKYS